MNKNSDKRLNKLISIQKGEHCALVVRKHWFIFFREAIGVILATLFLWTALGIFIKVSNLNDGILTFWQALVVFIGVLTLFVIWTNYYLDMWIVTNKRVLHVDQIKLFSRMIAATRIDRVQDVKAKISGFIPTMLGFGDLHVQTAGTNTAIMHIRGIPRPNEVRRVILKYLDHAIDSAHNHDGVGHN
jgi:hypothetical protein